MASEGAMVMTTMKTILRVLTLAALASVHVGHAQVVARQVVDKEGAPQYRVDPFWPNPLPNRWSMQQVTGLSVDQMDHVWFLNRNQAAQPIELTAEGTPSPALCCVRGPELIEVDQQGNVGHAWGGAEFHPKWPIRLQTVIADSKGFVWISGEANQDSILKFTREGKLVWDFDHRPPPECGNDQNNVCKGKSENNQETNFILNKGRFQLDEVANELYIISHKRVLVYDASTGAYKRGWGGHGMPLGEISNAPIAGYTWTGGPPPDERNFVPDLHFVEISKDRRVYIGERGQNRIQVFTTEGRWLQDIMVSPNSPAQRGECGGLNKTPLAAPGPSLFNRSLCGTTYKMVISKDPQQKYLFVADAHNDVIWIIERQSGRTLGHFASSGRLAGQLHFPNAIGIDTHGNIFVGEVDNAKRIQKFAPVLQ
jgi:hypothetical protein